MTILIIAIVLALVIGGAVAFFVTSSSEKGESNRGPSLGFRSGR